MKQIFSFFVAAVMSAGLFASTTFDFTSDASVNQMTDSIFVILDQGNGTNPPKYYSNGMRLYSQNTITVRAAQITRVEMRFLQQGTKAYADLTTSVDTLTPSATNPTASQSVVDVWTGDAQQVVFTLGTGQRIIQEIIVFGVGGDAGEEEIVIPDDLDPDYEYDEPTLITVPEISVNKQEYRFVQENVEVHCNMGSIVHADTITDYFGCNANYKLTFTATQEIKGLRINGWVRKNFTADVDHGEIEYISPEDDLEAEPVIVVRDIDFQQVTIRCNNQLRCYEVELYFEENPHTLSDTIALVTDTAEAVYYADYSEEGSYSHVLYLYDAATEYPEVALDLYTASLNDMSGVYTVEDGNLGDYSYVATDEEYYAMIVDGEVTVTKTGVDTYLVTGWLEGDDANVYTISYSGICTVNPYDDDDDDDDDDDPTGIKTTSTDTQALKILRNGQLLIRVNSKEYTALGQ